MLERLVQAVVRMGGGVNFFSCHVIAEALSKESDKGRNVFCSP